MPIMHKPHRKQIKANDNPVFMINNKIFYICIMIIIIMEKLAQTRTDYERARTHSDLHGAGPQFGSHGTGLQLVISSFCRVDWHDHERPEQPGHAGLALIGICGIDQGHTGQAYNN